MKPRPLHAFLALTTLGATITTLALIWLPDALPAGWLLTLGGTVLSIGEWLHDPAEAAQGTSQPTPTPDLDGRDGP